MDVRVLLPSAGQLYKFMMVPCLIIGLYFGFHAYEAVTRSKELDVVNSNGIFIDHQKIGKTCHIADLLRSRSNFFFVSCRQLHELQENRANKLMEFNAVVASVFFVAFLTILGWHIFLRRTE